MRREHGGAGGGEGRNERAAEVSRTRHSVRRRSTGGNDAAGVFGVGGRSGLPGGSQEEEPQQLQALKEDLEVLRQDTAQIQQRRTSFRHQLSLRAGRDAYTASSRSLSASSQRLSQSRDSEFAGNPRADKRLTNHAAPFNSGATMRLSLRDLSDGFHWESREGNALVLQSQHPLGDSAEGRNASLTPRGLQATPPTPAACGVASGPPGAGTTRDGSRQARTASASRPRQEVCVSVCVCVRSCVGACQGVCARSLLRAQA